MQKRRMMQPPILFPLLFRQVPGLTAGPQSYALRAYLFWRMQRIDFELHGC